MSVPTVQQSVSVNAHGGVKQLGEGSKTQVVYSLIRDQRYQDAIKLLQVELEKNTRSRAALSLLGYCFYYSRDFERACEVYRDLVRFHPSKRYRMYYAQALYKAGDYKGALKAASAIDDPSYQYRVLQLKTAIAYDQDDLPGTKAVLKMCIAEDAETIVANACVLYKEGSYDEAIEGFQKAITNVGYSANLFYNIALCYYKQGNYAMSVKYLAQLIESGMCDHPELAVGSPNDGVTSRSVGNSQTLKETALIEAFNLKAAIEYDLKKMEAARDCLAEMPPRSEEELDPVTLHNQALVNMDTNPSDGFKKLNFLLSRPPFPPETLGNLLLLLCKHEHYDLCADVLAENQDVKHNLLSEDLLTFIEACCITQSDPQEAYRRFEVLAKSHVDDLRKLTKKIQDARYSQNNQQLDDSMKEYDEALHKYIPVLMAQAKIYWDRKNYVMCEKLFGQAAELACEHEVWKMNVAHVFYMQANKFKKAIKFYEPLVREHIERGQVLEVTAIVLANLCVSYIMTSENKEAETVMKQIERQELIERRENPEKQYYHLCIVNLVIGTLYCAKGKFEFGISRIITSLEPCSQKLEPDTWYYAKNCVLALFETLAKHMMVLKDSLYDSLMSFLDQAEEAGRDILTMVNTGGLEDVDETKHNVAYEARQLKCLLMLLNE